MKPKTIWSTLVPNKEVQKKLSERKPFKYKDLNKRDKQIIDTLVANCILRLEGEEPTTEELDHAASRLKNGEIGIYGKIES